MAAHGSVYVRSPARDDFGWIHTHHRHHHHHHHHHDRATAPYHDSICLYTPDVTVKLARHGTAAVQRRGHCEHDAIRLCGHNHRSSAARQRRRSVVLTVFVSVARFVAFNQRTWLDEPVLCRIYLESFGRLRSHITMEINRQYCMQCRWQHAC